MSASAVEERYRRDPQFRSLVDFMRGMIEQYRFTPSELREAAIFAATLYEMRHFPSYFIAPESLREALGREVKRTGGKP